MEIKKINNNCTAQVLRRIVSEKIKRNPRYSLRALSRNLKVSPSFVSALLNGKKKLPFQRAMEFTQILKLSEEDAKELFKAVTIDGAKDEDSRQFLVQSFGNTQDGQDSNFLVLEMDRFRVLSDWYHLAILDLTLVESFVSESQWVAHQLGISEFEVTSAVQRLERLGLLTIEGGRWRKSSAKITIPTTRSERAVREFHAQMIDKAKDALVNSDPSDFDFRDINGTTMSIDPRRIPEAKQKIQKFRRQLLEFLSTGEVSELYQLNVQLFRLTKTPLTRYIKRK